jgi:hypothetical protein
MSVLESFGGAIMCIPIQLQSWLLPLSENFNSQQFFWWLITSKEPGTYVSISDLRTPVKVTDGLSMYYLYGSKGEWRGFFFPPMLWKIGMASAMIQICMNHNDLLQISMAVTIRVVSVANCTLQIALKAICRMQISSKNTKSVF